MIYLNSFKAARLLVPPLAIDMSQRWRCLTEPRLALQKGCPVVQSNSYHSVLQDVVLEGSLMKLDKFLNILEGVHHEAQNSHETSHRGGHLFDLKS